nr:hypothetical protein TetV2_00093 [Oceanusvirus sp.]
MFSACQLGLAVMGASLAVSMLSKPSKKAFTASLSDEQLEVYRGISRKRLMIYLVSLALGGLAGYGTLMAAGTDAETVPTVCKAVAAAGLVTYVVYMIWPKSRWMLQYTSPEQTALWVRYYRDMSLQYHLGFATFVAGYAILMRSQCGGK